MIENLRDGGGSGEVQVIKEKKHHATSSKFVRAEMKNMSRVHSKMLTLKSKIALHQLRKESKSKCEQKMIEKLKQENDDLRQSITNVQNKLVYSELETNGLMKQNDISEAYKRSLDQMYTLLCDKEIVLEREVEQNKKSLEVNLNKRNLSEEELVKKSFDLNKRYEELDYWKEYQCLLKEREKIIDEESSINQKWNQLREIYISDDVLNLDPWKTESFNDEENALQREHDKLQCLETKIKSLEHEEETMIARKKRINNLTIEPNMTGINLELCQLGDLVEHAREKYLLPKVNETKSTILNFDEYFNNDNIPLLKPIVGSQLNDEVLNQSLDIWESQQHQEQCMPDSSQLATASCTLMKNIDSDIPLNNSENVMQKQSLMNMQAKSRLNVPNQATGSVVKKGLQYMRDNKGLKNMAQGPVSALGREPNSEGKLGMQSKNSENLQKGAANVQNKETEKMSKNVVENVQKKRTENVYEHEVVNMQNNGTKNLLATAPKEVANRSSEHIISDSKSTIKVTEKMKKRKLHQENDSRCIIKNSEINEVANKNISQPISYVSPGQGERIEGSKPGQGEGIVRNESGQGENVSGQERGLKRRLASISEDQQEDDESVEKACWQSSRNELAARLKLRESLECNDSLP